VLELEFPRTAADAGRLFRGLRRRVAGTTLLGLLAALGLLSAACGSFPDPLEGAAWSTALLDGEGDLLGARIATDGQWRFAPEGKVNARYEKALLEYEDRRFRLHPGVDPAALLRAAWQLARSRRVVSGGSTITMQTVRLLRAGMLGSGAAPPAAGRRGLPSKIAEILGALRLEASLPKDRILRLYASAAPFGGNVVGLEAASWRWLGRGSGDLSWADAALLAVLPNDPALVHPGSRREELKVKRDALLARLARRGALDREQYELALLEPIPAAPVELPRLAPQLVDRARGREGGAGGRAAASIVRTSLDRSTQVQAQAILDRGVARYSGNGILNGACLVVDLETGRVLAYAGNSSAPATSSSSPFVDLVRARRSSGSLLKPFLFAAMLESGELLPGTLVWDLPTSVRGYVPENDSRKYSGAVPAREALARSLNVPAVRELRAFGVDRFAALLRGLGVSTLFRPASEYGLPLVLGGAEVTLWEITALYAGLARTALSKPGPGRERAFAPPTWLASGEAVDPRGAAGPTAANPYSAASAWLTLEALVEVARPGEEGAWQEYASSSRIAWKTGTSFGFRDAWSIGVTPRYAIGVWIGNASGEGRPELRGILTAAPILFELFSSLPSSGWFPRPDAELATVRACARSGQLAGPSCEETVYSAVPAAGAASAPCPYCRKVALNASGTRRVTVPETPIAKVRYENRFVLPPAAEWFYRKSHYEYKPLPPFEGRSGSRPEARSFSILAPGSGSILYVPVELGGELGQLVFEVAARDPATTLYWHLDESYLGSTTRDHRIECRPAPGRHLLTVMDEAGNMDQASFTAMSK
jgi:penicillin-binding protein 1C